MKKFETGKSRDIDKFNEWFNHCSHIQIPYIIIINHNKYSEVKWDYINLDKKLDKVFVNNNKNQREELLNIFNKYANSKSHFTVSNLTFNAQKIPIENAVNLAEELFDIILNRIQKK